MNLNTIRLEGKLETDEFYNLADEHGVLIMAGWCCCDNWEQWKHWQPGDLEIATASLHSQIMRMRSHPSMLVWLNGSDNPPPANVETAYIKVLKESDWPNPYISSASATPTTVTGPSGVKMTGPYDYVPPDYWLIDTNKYGGAFGFNTETGPGPAVPLAKLPEKFHSRRPHVAAGSFLEFSRGFGRLQGPHPLQWRDGRDLRHVRGPRRLPREIASHGLRRRTRHVRSLLSQQVHSTGIIQWMLNNAWPSHDLAPLRLLSAAGRRIFRHEESLRASARAIFLRRQQHRCRQ